MVLFTEGEALVPMSFIQDELLWCPDNDGRLVDIANCLDGNPANTQNGQTTAQAGGMTAAVGPPQCSTDSVTAATVLAAAAAAAMELQQQQQQNDANNNISSSSSSNEGGAPVHCDLANLDSLEGEPEEILRQLAEHPFEIEYFFSDMPGVEVKEEILTDMVGYDDSAAFITSSFTASSPGPHMNEGGGCGGGGGVSTTTGGGGGGCGQANQGRYSISANSLLAEKLMAASTNNNNHGEAEGLMTMGQQRPAGKPPDPSKGKWSLTR